MRKETLRKLVAKWVYKMDYDPQKAPKVDWEQLTYDYEHEPGIISKYLKNEGRANFYRQELVLVENQLSQLASSLRELETKHEKWFFEDDILYRYRSRSSIERTKLLDGPEGKSIEEWAAYFYNELVKYREEIEVHLGITVKGDIGEQNVAECLEDSKYKDGVIHNVVLDVSDEGGKTNEIDTYVITTKGIFVLEVKNYGKAGRTLVITDDDKWDLLDSKTKRAVKQEKNPAYQNKRHTNATLVKIREWLGKEVPIFPLVVIGNNAVKLERRSSMEVSQIYNLVAYIENIKGPDVFTQEEIADLKRRFEQADIGSNEFVAKSYREQVYHIMGIMERIYPYLGLNQVTKEVFYRLLQIHSYVFIGLIIAILLITGIVTLRIDYVLTVFVLMCIVLSAGFFAVHIVQRGKAFIEEMIEERNYRRRN